MDVSVQYAEAVKEDLTTLNDWGKLWSNCKQGNSTVGNSSAEHGSALEEALVLLSTSASSLEECGVCDVEKDKECGKLVINQEESLTVTYQTQLGENVALPSGTMLAPDVRGTGKDKRSTTVTALDGQSSLESGSPTNTSIMSLGTSLKLVSAMKGSREKQGVHVGKPSVTWAPDVYDPPATSQSHAVKSNNQHYSMTNKKSNRHKHKGKSPRSSSTDKKHHRKISRSSSKVASY